MKKFWLVGLLSLAAPLWAEAPPKEVVTGSHIPRAVERTGQTVNTIAPVYVLDRQDLQRAGGTTVGQALRRVPFLTVGGGR
jgi:outer membrane cobalamin receptor